jgi:preprotein translocase subunit YajC
MGGGAAIIIWILVFFGIFYFLAIRPQRRQKQAHADMVRMLKKGDEVVTIGGMFGTVTRIGDDWVELEVAKRTRVRYLKRAVSQITVAEEDEEDEYIEAEADEEELEELPEGEEVYDEAEEYEEAEGEEVLDEAEEEAEVAEQAPEEPKAPEPPKG